jgi:subtilisin-like proprotein convertase family protein
LLLAHILGAPAALSAPSSKDADLQKLVELQNRISDLKAQLASDPQNGELRRSLKSALKRYAAVSGRLGGDEAPIEVDDGAVDGRQRGLDNGFTPPPMEGTVGTGCPTSAFSFTNSTPVTIPTGPAVVTSTLVVAGADTYLIDLNLTTFITHTFASDLDITLMSPAGTVCTLTSDNGLGNDNVFNGTVWDDEANPGGQVPYATNNGLATDHTYVNLVTATPLVPEESFGAFRGEDPNGTWTITVSDDFAADVGTLSSWTLDVVTSTCAASCTLTCPPDQCVETPDPNGAVVTYPAPTTSGTCGAVTCAPASGSTFPVGTTVVTCSEPGGANCSFDVNVFIAFDYVFVDDFTGDTISVVVSTGYWEYNNLATGNLYCGEAEYVVGPPTTANSLTMRDVGALDNPVGCQLSGMTLNAYFNTNTCSWRVNYRPTGQIFTGRDRNILNNAPPAGCGP